MVVNVQKLKGKIVEKSNTQECVADAMGMNRSTFYRKMKNNAETCDVSEVYAIADILKLSPSRAGEIFFSE